ncbi:AbiH family protein [Flavobacterium sp. KJJ]|uniref:AbiH family protein n=1 Tax=Flavobacterium sp. KJJ TaxID=1270193 RepID=UPI000492FFDF|nr:AbiH family protein [Flavobacterium sp. KJJ]
MNRIILIGNGFDLAHGMRTSYNDFISYYWYKIISDIKSTKERLFENTEIIITRLPRPVYFSTIIKFEELHETLERNGSELIFKNKFLEYINNKRQIQNWVDIENEYYLLLKESFKNENCTYTISQLNSDFTGIQKLLENYLRETENYFKENFDKNVANKHLRNSIAYKIYADFKFKDFTESAINKKAELEFQNIREHLKFHDSAMVHPQKIANDKQNRLISAIGNNAPLKDIRARLLYQSSSDYFDLQPEEILFLNFNYTFTERLYYDMTWFDLPREVNKNLEKSVIHIHGTTNEKDNNNVIFGFGDEIDEDYKSIENLNENSYLENIKSTKYFETDNYKKLLEFLNSGDYQIFIFGHSCGNSDRTLLSTLFEHKNCVSIKPFYHKRENDDNYSEIVRNITRNFSNKAVLRDKVVNKEYCEPLT